jgi:hypothetical protein
MFLECTEAIVALRAELERVTAERDGAVIEARLLRGQLADKERFIQRLLAVEQEQAAEVERLQTLVALVEAAASV